MSDNEPDRIESATHNTFQKKMDIEIKILRVMSPTEFKMQPTTHFQKKSGIFSCQYAFFFWKCIVVRISNSIRLIIITLQMSCISH
jgi:hypothetical protein